MTETKKKAVKDWQCQECFHKTTAKGAERAVNGGGCPKCGGSDFDIVSDGPIDANLPIPRVSLMYERNTKLEMVMKTKILPNGMTAVVSRAGCVECRDMPAAESLLAKARQAGLNAVIWTSPTCPMAHCVIVVEN